MSMNRILVLQLSLSFFPELQIKGSKWGDEQRPIPPIPRLILAAESSFRLQGRCASFQLHIVPETSVKESLQIDFIKLKSVAKLRSANRAKKPNDWIFFVETRMEIGLLVSL